MNLLLAMKISPRQTHSSFRRQVFPGRLKSHAVQTSSETIDGGCKKKKKKKVSDHAERGKVKVATGLCSYIDNYLFTCEQTKNLQEPIPEACLLKLCLDTLQQHLDDI